MKQYIGLDTHSKQITYVIINEQKDIIGKGIIETSLAGVLQLLKDENISKNSVFGIEAGSQAFWVSRLLVSKGMNPMVLSSDEVAAKKSRKKRKTDFIDAEEIAKGISVGLYERLVYVPEEDIELLRSLYSLRLYLKKISTASINAAKGKIRNKVPGKIMHSLSTEAGWKKFLQGSDFKHIRHEIKVIFSMWKTANSEIVKVEKQIDKRLKKWEEVVERFMQIPGIGKLSAGAFIAAIGDPERFSSAKKVGSYLGLVPSENSSGERSRKGRITKQGPSYVRQYLYLGVGLHSVTHETPFTPHMNKVRAKTGITNKGIVAVAHKAARIMWGMWKNGTEFDPSKFNIGYTQITRTSKKYILIRQEE